jgi:hypothetical protein
MEPGYKNTAPRAGVREGTSSILQPRFAIALEQVATNKARVLRSFNESVYHFADVLTSGVVAESKCGKTSVQPVPRQIVLFASPSHWWGEGHVRIAGAKLFRRLPYGPRLCARKLRSRRCLHWPGLVSSAIEHDETDYLQENWDRGNTFGAHPFTSLR